MQDNNIALNAKILVVDDDPLNIRNAVRILKDDYKVSYATSGQAAIEQVEKDIPDLILLDIHMPNMNGFEVISSLKSNELYSEIPVIFLTADTDQETEVQGLKAGALDFIAKPFKDDIVKQRVRHLLELSILQKDLKSEVERQTAKAEERRKKMEEMSFQTVQALAGAIDAKDRYTKGHSSRVSEYAVMLARKAGWSDKDLDDLKYAGLLHDVGKIGVPDVVLNKPGRLSDMEFNVIKSHTVIGGDILKNITNVAYALEVARHHHERYDGKGYPDGLKGEDIPVMARITCIADSYDAMNSKRIYRNALPKDVIRQELIKGRGTQFDSEYLDIFLEMFDKGELDIEDKEETGSVTDNAAIIKRVFESAYDIGASNQMDALTGLPLRNHAENKIREKMVEKPGSIILIDLDNLKKLNDLFGHIEGDSILKALGKLLTNLDGVEVAARLGGDEFIVFTTKDTSEKLKTVLDSLYDGFEAIKETNPNFKFNSLSCGICMTDTTDVYEDVCGNADKALYYAKRNGKGNYHYYERESALLSENKDVDLQSLVNSFETAGNYNGAMQVDYREFTQIFEYIKNMRARYNHDIQLVMVTLDAVELGTANIDKIGNAITAMDGAIANAIRTVDIYTRYTSMQFLIILVGSTKEETPKVMERIFSNYYKTFDDMKVVPSYQVANI